MLNAEGDVGKPPAVCPSSTLWQGIQALDGSVLAIGTYLQGDLAQDLATITTVAQSASSMAKKATTGMKTLNLSLG